MMTRKERREKKGFKKEKGRQQSYGSKDSKGNQVSKGRLGTDGDSWELRKQGNAGDFRNPRITWDSGYHAHESHSQKKSGDSGKNSETDESQIGNCVLSVLNGNFSNNSVSVKLLEDAVSSEGLSVVKTSGRQLNDGTYLITSLLKESHAALHIYSTSMASFELYTCKSPQGGEKSLEFILCHGPGYFLEIDHRSFPVVSTMSPQNLRKWHRGMRGHVSGEPGSSHYFAAEVMYSINQKDARDHNALGQKMAYTVESACSGKPELAVYDHENRFSMLAYSNGCFFALHLFQEEGTLFVTSNSPGRGEISHEVLSQMALSVRHGEIFIIQNSLDIQPYSGQEMQQNEIFIQRKPSGQP